jgi:hypothetical protein
MEAIAHNKAFAKKVGIPQSVGRDFSNADKGKTFKKGGETMAKDDKAQDKKMIKKAVGMHDKQQHGGKKTSLTTLKKGGMAMKKMAGGGLSAGHKDANGVAKKGLTKGNMVKMNMGGRAY